MDKPIQGLEDRVQETRYVVKDLISDDLITAFFLLFWKKRGLRIIYFQLMCNHFHELMQMGSLQHEIY